MRCSFAGVHYSRVSMVESEGKTENAESVPFWEWDAGREINPGVSSTEAVYRMQPRMQVPLNWLRLALRRTWSIIFARCLLHLALRKRSEWFPTR